MSAATQAIKADEKVLKVLSEYYIQCSEAYTSLPSPTALCKKHGVNPIATRACIELGYLAKANDRKLYLWKVGAPTEEMAELVTNKIKAINVLNNHNNRARTTIPAEHIGRRLIAIKTQSIQKGWPKPTSVNDRQGIHNKYLSVLNELCTLTDGKYTSMSMGDFVTNHRLGKRFGAAVEKLGLVNKRLCKNGAYNREFKWSARCYPTIAMVDDVLAYVSNKPSGNDWSRPQGDVNLYQPTKVDEGTTDKMIFVSNQNITAKEEMFLRDLRHKSNYHLPVVFTMRTLTRKHKVSQRAGLVATEMGFLEAIPTGYKRKSYRWIAGDNISKGMIKDFKTALQKDKISERVISKPKAVVVPIKPLPAPHYSKAEIVAPAIKIKTIPLVEPVVERIEIPAPAASMDEKQKKMSIAKKLMQLGDLDGAEKVLDSLIEQN